MLRLVRRLAVCLTTAALAAVGLAGSAHAADPPAPRDLDGAAWQYAPDPGDVGQAQDWVHGGGTPAWKAAKLPHVFDPHPAKSTFAGRVGWYRLPITAPKGAAGFAWGVHFEQVRRSADVYLDGQLIAEHRDPYAPFTVALPGLTDGRQHTLVVRVDNRKGAEPREGWWNWGGITRPAQLVALGSLTTDGTTGFLPQRRCAATGDGDATACRWSVLVDTVVTNRGARTQPATLDAVLTDPAGAPVGRGHAVSRPLAPGESARVRFTLAVSGDAQLWAPGHPSLYGATLRASAGAAVQQVDTAHIGLRTVTVRHGLVELNGRPIELRGASIQEDVDGHGAALTDRDVAGIVGQLKALGANVTRAHYALDERLQSALDRAGILVWTQAPIYHRDELLKTVAQRTDALATVRATIYATRNHPSTLTHSVANELSVIPDQLKTTAAFLHDARLLTLDLDPTLPTAVDTLSYPGFPRQEAYAAFQLLGINSYFGWYPGKPDHSTADIRALGPYLKQMRAMYPGTGLVLTEFGAESTMTGPASEKETFAFQQVYTQRTLDAVRAAPTLSGAIYWTLQEFAIKPDWDGGAQRVGIPRTSIHHKGLITYDGRPKPAYDVVRADIKRTPLDRSDADVALALGTRVPDADRGRLGIGLTWAILASVLVLLALDVWAYLGWRRAAHAQDGRRRPPTIAAEDDDDERPRLRLVS
jgi:beta-glucuronidase